MKTLPDIWRDLLRPVRVWFVSRMRKHTGGIGHNLPILRIEAFDLVHMTLALVREGLRLRFVLAPQRDDLPNQRA
jgi:hypothetical protein